MNRRHYKKIHIICFLLFGVLFVCGFEWNEKIIKLTEKDLLDLDKAIQTSLLGVDPSDGQSEGESDQVPDSDEDAAEETESDVEEEIPVVEIVIHGKVVNYNGEPHEVSEILETLSELNDQQQVKLTDDYAEAHLYRDLNEKLTDLCKNKGFIYEAD